VKGAIATLALDGEEERILEEVWNEENEESLHWYSMDLKFS
jgi:hypothetical protein